MQQLYLDLGQKNFGKQILCDLCGMLYVHGVAEDAKAHAKVCQHYVQGVPFSTSHARHVASVDQDAIIEVCTILNSLNETNSVHVFFSRPSRQVRPNDSLAIRKKVEEVRKIVNQELGFVTSNDKESQYHTFLYIKNKRVVGMLGAERLERAYALLCNNYFERSLVAERATIGIHQIWVHSKFRRNCIASRLVDTAREKMVYGLTVPADEVAFSSPTEAGISFAKHYVSKHSTGRVLVYDCK